MTLSTTRPIGRLARVGPASETTDRDLLRRFAEEGDQAAFSALVARHSPMVLGVCRRSLGNAHDAEDACQATFVVLARKAGGGRWQPSIANWLYATARRVARNARIAAQRRAKRTGPRAEPASKSPLDDISGTELLAILDEELDRLSPRYREPIVLCHLEGLTRDEASARLAIPPATLKSQLERGRNRLAKAMEKRGVALGAAMVAVAAGQATRSMAARPILSPTPSVQQLAESVVGLGAAKKLILTTVVVVAVAVLGTGVPGTAPATPTSAQPAKAGVEKPNEQSPAPPVIPDTESATIAGIVKGPGGKPIAGAKVYYYFLTRGDEPLPVRATTDADGKFEYTLTGRDIPPTADLKGRKAIAAGFVVAKADGYTFDWRHAGGYSFDPASPSAGRPSPIPLQLDKDEYPITGRVISLEGKPIAGVRVIAAAASRPEKLDENLDEMIAGLAAKKSFVEVMGQFLHHPFLWRRPVPLLPSVTTASDGRFRIDGFARERVVQLRIEGEAVERQEIMVINRPGAKAYDVPLVKIQEGGPPSLDSGEKVRFRPNGGDLVAAPGRAVEGTIRDAASKEPIAGALVESYLLAGTNIGENLTLRTTSDANGKYRLTGLPLVHGSQLRFRGGPGRPNVPAVKGVPKANALEPAKLDVDLKPGVWVDIQTVDADTGRPVPGYVSYFVLPKDPRAPFQSPEFSSAYPHMEGIRNDGKYRFVAVADQKSVVAFRADWGSYPIAQDAATRTLPSAVSSSNFQAFVDLNPKAGAEPMQVTIRLDSRRTVRGTLVDSDGKPVSGAISSGLRHDWFVEADLALSGNEFTALGLDPKRPRRIAFAHTDRKLVGSIVVRGDEKSPVAVKMQPWGVVTGRLLDDAGKPITNVELAFVSLPIRKPGEPMDVEAGIHVVEHVAGRPSRSAKLDSDGKFTIDGLIPGLKYNLAVVEYGGFRYEDVQWKGLVFRDVVVKPGETKALGDMRLQEFPAK